MRALRDRILQSTRWYGIVVKNVVHKPAYAPRILLHDPCMGDTLRQRHQRAVRLSDAVLRKVS